MICTWCHGVYDPRRGGKAQRFCSADCRVEYFAACRAWGEQEHRRGAVVCVCVVATETLRNAREKRARCGAGC